jgi:hypothetical protein
MSYRAYIAAPFVARDGLRDFADQLKRVGIECTSLWLLGEEDIATNAGAAPDVSREEIAKAARDDLRHVASAHAIVQFTGTAIEALGIPGATGPSLHSGGRQVELGYALAQNKRAIVVGHPENIFQRTLCTVVPDWHEALIELVALDRAYHAAQVKDEVA